MIMRLITSHNATRFRQVKGKTELERQQALLTAAAHEHKAQAEESARQSEQLRVAAEARAERYIALPPLLPYRHMQEHEKGSRERERERDR